MARAGRPSEYNDAVADRICEQLAEGRSLKSICSASDLPDRSTVARWIERYPEFAAKCARAWEMQGLHDADEQREVIQQVQTGVMPPDVGRVVLGGLQWLSERKAPKWLGKRDALKIQGDPAAPVEHRHTLDAETASRIDALITQAAAMKNESS